jgi:hypothetical protein
MRAPSFAKTAQKHLIAGVKEKDLHTMPCPAHLAEHIRPVLKEMTLTKIDSESDPLDSFLISLAEVDKFENQ